MRGKTRRPPKKVCLYMFPIPNADIDAISIVGEIFAQEDPLSLVYSLYHYAMRLHSLCEICFEDLAKEGILPTSMIDISDGLSSELMHICTQSHTGCRIYEDRIPIDYQTAVMAEELNMNVTTCALNGGEDYELLFTVPLTAHDKVAAMKGVKVIGHITKPELGLGLITRDGQEFELKAQGWNPLTKK